MAKGDERDGEGGEGAEGGGRGERRAAVSSPGEAASCTGWLLCGCFLGAGNRSRGLCLKKWGVGLCPQAHSRQVAGVCWGKAEGSRRGVGDVEMGEVGEGAGASSWEGQGVVEKGEGRESGEDPDGRGLEAGPGKGRGTEDPWELSWRRSHRDLSQSQTQPQTQAHSQAQAEGEPQAAEAQAQLQLETQEAAPERRGAQEKRRYWPAGLASPRELLPGLLPAGRPSPGRVPQRALEHP